MALPGDVTGYSHRMGPEYQPGSSSGSVARGPDGTPTSVNGIILDAAQLAQANNDTLKVSDLAQVRGEAWALMPTLSQPDQTKLMQFLSELQQQMPMRAGDTSTSGVLLTTPPTQNPFTNGPNIQLIMMVLFGEMTKMANEGTLDMAKLQLAQMQAKLDAAIQTATLQKSSAEAQAQQLEADAATARAAAFAAMTQFVVSVVVTSVQVGMNLGARTKTDTLAGYGDTKTAAGQEANAAASIGSGPNKSAFGNAATGQQDSQQYAAYTRSRQEDLLVYNKTLDFLTSAGQTLTTFASKQTEAENDIKKAELTRLKGQVDAAVSMLQMLSETMAKSIDVVSSAKDAYKDMLQGMKQMVESVFQLATRMSSRG